MLTLLGLMLLGATVAAATRKRALHEVAWPDECIYLVGARNIVERGTLNTNFYLTHSLLLRGYPHRDVHMPGYVLLLAPLVGLLGASLKAGAALNVVLFLGSAGLVYALARGLLKSHPQAATAAALFTILPPFPGYLFVVYPEIVVSFVFLAGLAWLVNGPETTDASPSNRWRTLHAAIGGVLYGLGALFRETLLLALPLYLVRIRRREMLRGFLPASLAALLLVVAPLARDRAIHPNAIYPGLFEEAQRSDAPLATLAAALTKNLRQNLRLGAAADPGRSPEDAVLLFFALLVMAVILGLRHLSPAARAFARAAIVSLALLSTAVLLLYVVRERGGVWGGVRIYMAWAPVLLVLAMPFLFRPVHRWLTAALTLALAAAFLTLDLRQVRFFNRYKGTDLEDQDRNAGYIARYIDRHHPQRILSRSFTYGFTHYPVEVIWSLPRDHRELLALERTIGFDFVVLHERSPIRLSFVDNPRYLRINKDDRGAEFLIWRRLY